MFVPTQVLFIKGVGRHKDYLQSFELALRDAGVEKCNLVTVSSILPPGCQRLSIPDGLKKITFVMMARNATNEPNRQKAIGRASGRPL